MKIPKRTKGKAVVYPDLRKEAAIKKDIDRKRNDHRISKILKNQPKLRGSDLFMYQDACELYAEKLKAFRAGKIVKTSGKGKDKVTTVTISTNHTCEPSFNKIYKMVLTGKTV